MMIRAGIPHPSRQTVVFAAIVFVLVPLLGVPAVAATGPRAQTVAPPPSTAPSPPTGDPGNARDRLRDRLPPPFGTGPSFIDIGARVRDAVNGWFRDLAASALDPLLDLVGRTILATPNLTAASSRVHELWLVSAGIANTGFVLLILAGAVLVMGHETIQTSYGVKEIAPRLLLAFLAANLSLFLAGQAIPLANALTRALLGTGADADHVRATLKTWRWRRWTQAAAYWCCWRSRWRSSPSGWSPPTWYGWRC